MADIEFKIFTNSREETNQDVRERARKFVEGVDRIVSICEYIDWPIFKQSQYELNSTYRALWYQLKGAQEHSLGG